ncbi:MAG: hypothetical protein D6706_03950 [Chloroflexi bacterium]|nr:MAG: hypothetical protein D6706_03950 [Chloroflexota bacterium]
MDYEHITSEANRHLVRVLFWGTQSVFAQVVLAGMLAQGVAVCGVMLPGETAVSVTPRQPDSFVSDLPLLTPYVAQDTVHIAWANRLPVWEVGQEKAQETLSLLKTLHPDVVVTACWPRRIPVETLAVPEYGFWNVHPSLLPDYRGPAPLFWQWRAGEPHMGVTLHQMDTTLDTGAIVAQREVVLPDGITGPEADRLLGRVGSELVGSAVSRLQQGVLSLVPQPAGGSYQSWPTDADFGLDLNWTARQAFNFMRGTAEWGRPYFVDVAGERLWLLEALDWYEDRQQKRPFHRQGNRATIQFRSGILLARTK